MPAGPAAVAERHGGFAETLQPLLRCEAMPSTAIQLISYDEATQRLTVIFVSGRRYLYESVPRHLYEAFVRAPSRGAFFNCEISGFYEYREIPRHDPARKRSA